MQTGSYVDLDYIIEKVDREKPANARYNESDIKEIVAEGLREIGSIESFDVAETELTIRDGRTLMPNNMLHVLGIRDVTSNTLLFKSSTLDKVGLESQYGYYKRGKYLYVNSSITKVAVIFNTYVKDDEGRPMVPDNQYFISAIVSKIVETLCKKLWLSGHMPYGTYEVIQIEWLYYLKSASVEAIMPTIDDMATWDSLHQLVHRRTSESHLMGYANLEFREGRVIVDNVTA